MLRNVEYSEKPAKYVYEKLGTTAYITLADNIRESMNADGEPCWLCDLYMMSMPDTDHMSERLEKSYDDFLKRAKELDAVMDERKPTVEDRVIALEAVTDDMVLMMADLIGGM